MVITILINRKKLKFIKKYNINNTSNKIYHHKNIIIIFKTINKFNNNYNNNKN